MTEVNVNLDLLNRIFNNISTPTTINNNNLANINNLKLIFNKPSNNFYTLEHNINILDGSLSLIDANDSTSNIWDNVTYFSKTLSDDNCNTSSQDVINITFNIDKYYEADDDIPGIVLFFEQNRINSEVILSYYRKNKLINVRTFYPTSTISRLVNKIIDVDRIQITFKKTQFPNTYTRLQWIGYGLLYNWTSKDILNCQIIEEVSPISSKLPINTCDLTIYTDTEEFDVISNTNIFEFITQERPFIVYGIIDEQRLPFGNFYIDTYDSSQDNQCTFHLISYLGVLDKFKYTDGYSGYYGKVGDLIPQLITSSSYSIDDNLSGIILGNGSLPPKSIRETLQLILFSIGACIQQGRNGKLKITTYQNQIDSEDIPFISPDLIFYPNLFTKNECVTSASIKLHLNDYPKIDNSNLNNAITTTIDIGKFNKDDTKEFIFDKPIYKAYSKVTNGGTWQLIDISSSDTGIVIDPTKYHNGNYEGYYKLIIVSRNTNNYTIGISLFNDYTYNKNIPLLEMPDDQQNIININDDLLLNEAPNNQPDGINKSLFDIFTTNLKTYFNKFKFKFEFNYIFRENIKTGSPCSIFHNEEGYFTGIIVKQNIDLSKGFIVSATMLVTNVNTKNTYYATPTIINDAASNHVELYAGENILI